MKAKNALYISIVCKCNTDIFSLMPGYSNAIVAYKTSHKTFFGRIETEMKSCRRCNPMKSLICRRIHP